MTDFNTRETTDDRGTTTRTAECAGFGEPARWAPRLDRILQEQEALYASLEELASGQGSFIESGDATALLRVLADRQSVLAELERSNEALAPFRRHWSELMETVAPEQRRGFGERIETMAKSIERITLRDETDRNSLSARRAEVSERLNDVTRSKSALSAYGRTRTGPRYQDREG